jgi:hypothetical protein
MATPDDQKRVDPKNLDHVYGNFHQKRGGYWFEWTPFTPAVVAWQGAERYLQHALDELNKAQGDQDIFGFAIPGLEYVFAKYKKAVKDLAELVENRRREAGGVARALDAANTSYAKAHNASATEYHRIMDIVNAATKEQGRHSPIINRKPNAPFAPYPLGPGDTFRVPLD